MELKSKMQQQRDHYTQNFDKMRADIENLTYDNKSTHQELNSLLSQKKEIENRLIAAESKKAELASYAENLEKENERNKAERDGLRKEFASIKYKYDSFEIERKNFEDKQSKATKQNEALLRKLAKVEADFKAASTTSSQIMVDKDEEIQRQRAKISHLEEHMEETQARLRQEFDDKINEFVTKREAQYNLEKDEWMRIFKDEFNRKIQSYKTANEDLGADNKKKDGDLADLRTRISKLRQQKTELEVLNRGNEEEVEKMRNDLDDLRRTKDEEVKAKNQQLHAERDRYKQKELEFDELAGIKVQLDAEIELYRSILNEAEEACGYMSPLDARHRNSAQRNSRKRRRFNALTPMGPLLEKTAKKTPAVKTQKVVTPGVERAAKMAEKDLKALESADEELKDEEEDDCFDVERERGDGDHAAYITPGNVEGATLTFSGLDLNKGMIEIQNSGENAIDLAGYCLSNSTGTLQYEMPKEMELENMGKMRIYVGKMMYDAMKSGKLDKDELVGDYKGTYVFWGRDVWTGNDKDCVRLYNPQQREVAIMEISPEMVDSTAAKNGCLVM